MDKIYKLCFSNIWRSVISFALVLALLIGTDAILNIKPDIPTVVPPPETSSQDITSSEITSSEEVSSEITSNEETSSEEVSSKETSSKAPSYPHTVKQENGISIAKVDKSKLNYYKKSVNSSTVGWIAVPNSNINYAVVQSSQSDPHYYNTRDYYKNYNSKGGSIWADAWCTFGTRNQLKNNTIIYGHNWTNCWRPTRIGYSGDKWFAQLAAYDNISFARQNPYISFSTTSEEMYWQIFAVMYVKEDWQYTSGRTYIDENADPAVLGAQAKKRSIFNFDNTVTSSDKILTLSTCTRVYGKRSDIRFVVMAKLVKGTENLPAVNVTKNPNPIQP